MKTPYRNLRIADLEVFFTAARLKSLGKSAEFHHVSQSAASAAIQRIESIFGIHLCTHKKSGFQLTQKGLMMLPKIEALLLRVNAFLPYQSNPLIAVPYSIADLFIPILFSTQNEFNFTVLPSDKIHSKIIQNEIDIAITLDSINGSRLIATEIRNGPFHFYSKNPEISEHSKLLIPGDLKNILFTEDHFKLIFNHYTPSFLQVPNWTIIAKICATSNQIGLLPDFLGQEYQLRPILENVPTISYHLQILNRALSTELQSKADFIISKIQQRFCWN